MAKRPSLSLSASSKVVIMVFSLSEVVRRRELLDTSKRKSPKMGKAFLLLITLERAVSLLLKAVLDTVNLIILFVFLFISLTVNIEI